MTSSAASRAADGIDCDIHPAIPSVRALLPYMSDVWQHTVGMIARGIEHLHMTSYPPGSTLACRPDWRPKTGAPAANVDLVRAHVLDHFALRGGILNPVHGAMTLTNGDLAAALCRAINDWIGEHWLSVEPRLSASIVVSLHNPGDAVEEIERRANDKRFVQVLVLAQGEMPLGRRYYWPLYAAAERHGLPIAIHPGSMFRHAPTQSGFPSTLTEDYITHAQAFGSQLASLVAEGVFAKFPGLKVVLTESGVSWLPSLMWRMGKDWRGLRTEVPWVDQIPAEIIRQHVRLTLQPLDLPPTISLERLCDHLGSDRLILFSTDYPHHQFDADDVVPPSLPPDLLRKVLVDNVLATYPRLTPQRNAIAHYDVG